MVTTLLVIASAFYWLLCETDYLRVRLLVGDLPAIPEVERISWGVCQSRYPSLKLSCGVEQPLCGWDWLKNNTHPIPQVDVSFSSGGVRYHWHIEDCNILKDAITATHYKSRKGNGQLHFRHNKLGGLVAPLPAKAH